MQILGYLESYVEQTLAGWALAVDRPGARLLLFVEVQGERIAAGLANLERRDVAQSGYGDGHCGFRITVNLPPGSTFNIREAESGIILFTQENLSCGSIGQTNSATTATLLKGQVDVVIGATIRGWCWVPADQNRHLDVEALVDGRVVAKGTANEVRGDLINASIGDGDHAYSLSMPYWMLDGVERLVTVTAEGQPLNGSPVKFASLAASPRTLLRVLADATHPADANIDRIALMLDSYLSQLEVLAPNSVGFSYYDEWLAAQMTGHRWVSAALPALPDTVNSGGTAIRLADRAGNILIALIDQGVTPMGHAIATLTNALNATGADAAYADAQMPTPAGMLPWFRPDWSYDLCLAQDYTRGITLFRESALKGIKGLNTVAGLRVAGLLACEPSRIHHLPEIICTLEHSATEVATAEVHQVVVAHLSSRTDVTADVQVIDKHNGLRRVDWPIPPDPPLVSLLIPTRDRLGLLQTAVDSIIQRTRYNQFEIIIIDNQSREPETLDWLEAGQRQGRFEVIRYDAPFNFSAMNNMAATAASGDIIGFINNDVELISADWLETAIGLLSRAEVGVVGARLRFANGMIQHGGVIVGTGGLAENSFQHVHVNDDGYFHRTRVAGNYSAVTAACMFCHRAEFLEIGGFDETNLPVAFNDVDFCLRMRERGRQIVWTPHIELYHYESVSRGRDNTPEKLARALKEELHMRHRWGRQSMSDPFYNPNLNLNGAPFTGLAIPPRRRWGEPQ